MIAETCNRREGGQEIRSFNERSPYCYIPICGKQAERASEGSQDRGQTLATEAARSGL